MGKVILPPVGIRVEIGVGFKITSAIIQPTLLVACSCSPSAKRAHPTIQRIIAIGYDDLIRPSCCRQVTDFVVRVGGRVIQRVSYCAHTIPGIVLGGSDIP